MRFRSFVPYTLPGVLALIGWWWYISRKKGRITSHDSEEGVGPAAMGLLSSPSEGSNGTMERGPHHKPSRGRCRVQEEPLLGQEVAPEVSAPLRVAVERVGPPTSSSCALSVETGGAEAVRQRGSAPETVEESVVLLGPEEGEDDCERARLDATPAVALAAGDSSVTPVPWCEQDPAPVVQVDLAPPASMPDPAQTSSVRPEPEGEVAAARTALPCAHAPSSKPVSTETAASAAALSTSSRITAVETGGLGLAQEDREAAEAAENTGEIERLAAGLITEVILAAAQEVLTVSRAEGGGRAVCPSPKDDDEEEERGGVWEPSSSTPVTNGRLCASRDPPPEDGAPSKGFSASGMEEDESSATNATLTAGLRLSDVGGEGLNGFLTPPVWEEPVGSSRQVESKSPVSCRAVPEATPPSLAKLRAEEGGGAAEDSGCSTCQSEDGVSSEDLLHSTGLSCPPGRRDDLLHISGISRGQTSEGEGNGPGRGLGGRSLLGAGPPCNGAGVGNGAQLAGETEADHSGGQSECCITVTIKQSMANPNLVLEWLQVLVFQHK